MEGDFALLNGVWHVFLDFEWIPITNPSLLTVLRGFGGVSGTGADQRFASKTGPDVSVSRLEVVNQAQALQAQRESGQLPSAGLGDLQAAMERYGLLRNGQFPPLGLAGQVDFELINSAIALLKREDSLKPKEQQQVRTFDLSSLGGPSIAVVPGLSAPVRLGPAETFGDFTSQAIPGTNSVLVTTSNGEVRVVEAAAARSGSLTSVSIPGTDKVLVTTPDGATVIVDKAKAAAIQQSGKIVTFPETGGRQFIQDPDGSLRPLDREFQPGIIQAGNREFLQQASGNISELASKFPAGIVARGGREFLQQPSGALGELAPRTPDAVMDQIISEAIISGDIDKALAFRDFRDRPTDQEALNFAFQFARSPADQLVVAALARGDQVVEQRPSTPTRIGPQPDFLINAFNKFQGRLGAGRPPTGEEAQFFLDMPRKREEQRLEQDRLRTEALNAQAQAATEKATQAGLNTLQQFLTNFGQQFGSQPQTGAGGTGVQTGAGGTGVQAGAGGGPTIGGAATAPTTTGPTLSEASLKGLAGQPTGNLTPEQVQFINAFHARQTQSSTQLPFEPSLDLGQFPQHFAEGGIAFGPTNAIIGEEEPEAVIPLSKLENFPIDVRFLQEGRPVPPSRGGLFRAAGLTIPSAQALQNLTPESLGFFRDLGALAGIPSQSFEQELRLGSPAGGRVRSPMFLPFLSRGG